MQSMAPVLPAAIAFIGFCLLVTFLLDLIVVGFLAD
jgi:hypothetical protein